MKKLGLIHLVILLCLSVFAFSTKSIASQKDGLLKVYFFDVGQGDSIFIEGLASGWFCILISDNLTFLTKKHY